MTEGAAPGLRPRHHHSTDSVWPWVIPITATPVVMGYLVGWLIGASDTPVVSVALPLLIGLISAVGYGITERRFVIDAIARRVMALAVVRKLDRSEQEEVEAGLQSHAKRSPWLPTLWGIGIIGFSVACLLGLNVGIERRLPTYVPVEELLGETQVTAEERASLYALRWQHRSASVPPNQSDDLIRHVFLPILAIEEPGARWKTFREAYAVFRSDELLGGGPPVTVPEE